MVAASRDHLGYVSLAPSHGYRARYAGLPQGCCAFKSMAILSDWGVTSIWECRRVTMQVGV